MPRTRDEIDQEKQHKPRPDLLPASALLAAGEIMGYGLRKHGACTWRVAGTEQADPRTHIASMIRHALAVADDIDSVDADGLDNLACVITQACIAFDCRARARATKPVTVGSAFAAGQVEGETPRGCDCPHPGLCHAEQRCRRGLR